VPDFAIRNDYQVCFWLERINAFVKVSQAKLFIQLLQQIWNGDAILRLSTNARIKQR
jgi:hypothetical protein